MRLAQDNAGDIVLVDIAKGISLGKSLDLEDARWLLNADYRVYGTDEISEIKGSGIVVITAGLARKPGMTREDLLLKNAQILKEVSLNIKLLAPDAIVIVVTNPLDLMTHLAFRTMGFKRNKVFGMGISLDASRFANMISQELQVPVCKIEAVVIGSHGESMLPLPRHTKVSGVPLCDFAGKDKTELLIDKTVKRGAQIVAALGTGSAFFAPSAAISQIVNCIIKDEKKIIGVCASLEGEYAIKDICIGVPCRLGKGGIEEVIELDLNERETKSFQESAHSVSELIKGLPCMI